jgi:spore maturation protein CgeB
MKIIYSFNKTGFEAEYWEQEIAAASTDGCTFLPFNHDPYLNPLSYSRAQLLDNLYFREHPGLMRLYGDVVRRIKEVGADVLLVDNCNPYHPEFLRTLNVYRVLRTSDGPVVAYDRDFAYLHAFDHILFHSPAYSRDLGMEEKLRYCGARRVDWWPQGSFDALCDPTKTELDILSGRRDIDILFIGAMHVGKMPFLASIMKAFGRRLRLHGLTTLKKNVYFNLRYGCPGWVRPVPFSEYVPLYQRAKVGINVHNRGDYTVGSYRLFDLPANGVMQISDGGEYLERYFKVGEEVVSHRSVDDLVAKVRYYLAHDAERERIALNGFRRVRREYRIGDLLRKAAAHIADGLQESRRR